MIKIMTKSMKKKGDALQESLPYRYVAEPHNYSMNKLFTPDIPK